MTAHGLTNTRTWRAWRSMRKRCLDPKSIGWANYGGRGIAFCERWSGFVNFLADMGECPDGLSLDRIDNAKGYEPSNCRWATPKEQANNTRSVRLVELDGELVSVSEAARRCCIRRATLRWRMDNRPEAEWFLPALEHQEIIRLATIGRKTAKMLQSPQI